MQCIVDGEVVWRVATNQLLGREIQARIVRMVDVRTPRSPWNQRVAGEKESERHRFLAEPAFAKARFGSINLLIATDSALQFDSLTGTYCQN